MNRISLQNRVLAALTVVGLAATLAGPVGAATPQPIIIVKKIKRSYVVPKRKPVVAAPLPVKDPPVAAVTPVTSSAKPAPVPPRMPPGPVGPPLLVPPTATNVKPNTSSTPALPQK